MKIKKDNKVKRKRGKKFVYHHNGDQQSAQELQNKQNEKDENPFENHSKSKRFKKDSEVRQVLVDEFMQRGRITNFVDKRLGENNMGKSKLSEEDMMRLRYMREQRDRLLKNNLASSTRKKQKFNLDDESEDDQNFDFLTHKGKKLDLANADDFKDEISKSDDEYPQDEMGRKGQLDDEMVNELNFGMGKYGLGKQKNNEGVEQEQIKKTREERHQEIMEKSKAYKFHAQEIKLATIEQTKLLDEEWGEVAGLLNFNRPTIHDTRKVLIQNKQQEQKNQKENVKIDTFDEILNMLKEEGVEKAVPKTLNKDQNENEKIINKREELERLQEQINQKNQVQDDKNEKLNTIETIKSKNELKDERRIKKREVKQQQKLLLNI